MSNTPRAEENRAVRQLPNPAAGADRLVVDADVRMKLRVLREPLGVDRIRKRGARAIDLCAARAGGVLRLLLPILFRRRAPARATNVTTVVVTASNRITAHPTMQWRMVGTGAVPSTVCASDFRASLEQHHGQARTVDRDPQVIVSRCDAIVGACGTIEDGQLLQGNTA
jgi:hypothetical protein